MISFLFNLLLMTLLLTMFGVAALLFRKKWLRGKGGAMYSVWACVLLLCVIPLKLLPELNLIGNFDFDSLMPEKVILPGSESDRVFSKMGSFRLTLIRDPDAVNPGERLDALYAIQPKVITGGSDRAAERLLDKTENYFVLFFGCTALVWGIGALTSFCTSIANYRSMKRRLTVHSAAYDRFGDDGRLDGLLEKAKHRVGTGRRVRIRVVDRLASVSPCVCGLIRPVIFLGEDILHLDDAQIELILIHELVHCHRCELLYKTAANAIASIHWFNPLMPLLLRTVYEDCELSCDSRVLALCGDDCCDYYMMTLLDVAEMYCRCGRSGERAMASGVYLTGGSGQNFLKKRYRNMKCKTRKGLHRGNVIFVMLCMAVNIVMISACSAGNADHAILSNMTMQTTEEDLLYRVNPIASAMNNYFGMTENCELSGEQLASVESIEVRLIGNETNSAAEGDYRICINGEYVLPFGRLVRSEDMAVIFACLSDYSESAYEKFIAFYVLKDPNDSALDEQSRAEMLSLFPMVAEESLYILDPYATTQEIHALTDLLEDSGAYVPFEKTTEGLRELAESYIREHGMDCTLSVTETTASF